MNEPHETTRAPFIYLIGYPGVGKYTVGRELVKRGGLILVDNHLINNPIFAVVGADGKTKLPEAVWEKVRAVRGIVFDAIVELGPRAAGFIFTNVLVNDTQDREVYARVAELAARRGQELVTVRMMCDGDENARRITTPERAHRMKTLQPSAIDGCAKSGVLEVDHPLTLTIDTTALSPAETASMILDHVKAATGWTPPAHGRAPTVRPGPL